MKHLVTKFFALFAFAPALGCGPAPPPAAKVNVGVVSAPRCEDRVSPAQKLLDKGDQVKAVDLDGAISLYEQAATLDPESQQAAMKLGMAYRKKEAWDKAKEAFTRATKRRPADADGFYLRGLTLVDLAKQKAGSWEEAKESFQRCVEVDPNFADCHAQQGKARLFLDDEQGALESMSQAVVHDPKRMSYYAALADLYLRLDLARDAEAVLKEAVKRAATDDKGLYDIHVLLSMVYQDRGAMVEMVGELEAARAVPGLDGPQTVEILFSLGSAYARLVPPRRMEAIQMLNGFHARACKGAKAGNFKMQCETGKALVEQLGGALK